jgi:hypothetical protein
MRIFRLWLVSFLALALSACGGSSSQSQAEVADAHFQNIANAMKDRNEASAPLASKITAVFKGEITQSDFIATYPALYNQSQEGHKPVQSICSAPPDLDAATDSVDYELATAMLELADEVCKSESYKNLYVLAAITAGGTLYQEDYDEMIRLFDEYTSFVVGAFEKFLENPVVTENMSEEELRTFKLIRDSFGG